MYIYISDKESFVEYHELMKYDRACSNLWAFLDLITPTVFHHENLTILKERFLSPYINALVTHTGTKKSIILPKNSNSFFLPKKKSLVKLIISEICYDTDAGC